MRDEPVRRILLSKFVSSAGWSSQVRKTDAEKPFDSVFNAYGFATRGLSVLTLNGGSIILPVNLF